MKRTAHNPVPENAPALERPFSVYELGWIDLHSAHRPQVISGLCAVADDVPQEVILDRVREFVANNRQYQSRISLSPSPSWKPASSFQLDQHVSLCSLEDASITSALNEVGEQSSRSQISDQPPWQVTLFRNVHPAADFRTAIGFCAHHSLTDGLGARRLFEVILDAPERSRERNAESTSSQDNQAASRRPVNALKFGLGLARDFSLRRRRDPFQGAPSSGRKVLELSCSRGRLQQARKTLNCSLQELLLLVLTRGLDRHCSRKGQFSCLRAIVPMADLVAARNDPHAAHHDIGYVELPLSPAGINQQLDRLRAGISRLQQRQVDRVFARLTRLLAMLPSRVRTQAAHRWSRNANLLISLLPGGPSKPTINGSEVTAVYGLPAIPPGQAIAIGIVISRDQVHLAVVLDPQLVPDHGLLANDLNTALDELVPQPDGQVAKRGTVPR